MQLTQKLRYILWTLPAMASYTVLATRNISFPAFYYDELFFVNAALGNTSGPFIRMVKFDIPIMLMPYIGALKSFLYMPIFWMANPSPLSIRLPVIVITALGIVIFYAWIRENRVSSLLAALTTTLLGMHPTFVAYTRTDIGPLVLEYVFLMSCLLLFSRYVKKMRIKYLVFFTLVALLGIYNKLHFIWLINAAIGAVFLVYRDRLLQISSDHKKWSLLFVTLIYAFFFLLYIYFANSSGTVSTANIGASFHSKVARLIEILDGSSFLLLIGSSKAIPALPHFFVAMMFVITLGLGYRPRHTPNGKLIVFSALMILFIFIQALATNAANGPWHYFSALPFFILIFSLSAQAIIHKLRIAQKLPWTVAVFSPFLIYYAVISTPYSQAYSEPLANSHFSSAIYELSEFANTHPGNYILTDWGIQTQLQALDTSNNSYTDMWGSLSADQLSADQKAYIFTTFLQQQNSKIVVKADQRETFPATKSNLFSIFDESPFSLELVDTISDYHGPLFTIYTVVSRENYENGSSNGTQ